MVSPLEDCMETSVKVKLKSQEKQKAIKLVEGHAELHLVEGL